VVEQCSFFTFLARVRAEEEWLSVAGSSPVACTTRPRRTKPVLHFLVCLVRTGQGWLPGMLPVQIRPYDEVCQFCKHAQGGHQVLERESRSATTRPHAGRRKIVIVTLEELVRVRLLARTVSWQVSPKGRAPGSRKRVPVCTNLARHRAGRGSLSLALAVSVRVRLPARTFGFCTGVAQWKSADTSSILARYRAGDGWLPAETWRRRFDSGHLYERDVAQQRERTLGERDVVGASPTLPTTGI
jgi:hypothetical protein